MEKLRAGVSLKDITPDKGVRLAGYPHFNRENIGAHDNLYCFALYLDNGEEEFVFVTLDILFYSKIYAREVRDFISAETGIKGENISITCSHTHSGPWAAGNPELKTVDDGKDRDPKYIKFLNDTIEKAIIEAKKGAVKAKIGIASGHCGKECGVGGNRTSPDGISDPSVNVVCVKDEGGKVMGVLVNYALHPTFLHEDSDYVSADYPAYVRLKVNEKYPDAFFGFAQGTSGDQSSRYFRQGQSFDEAKRVGDLIGAEVLRVIDGMKFEDSVVLKHDSVEIPIEIRKYPPAAELEKIVEQKTKEYNEAVKENKSYLDVQNANLRLLGAEDSLGYARCLEAGRKIDLLAEEDPDEINAWRIGDNAIVAFQGEAFVSFGLRIKEYSKAKNTFVFELTNGCMPGYCCDAEAYETDCYEAGNSMLIPGYGDRVVEAACRLLDNIF